MRYHIELKFTADGNWIAFSSASDKDAAIARATHIFSGGNIAGARVCTLTKTVWQS